MDTVQILDESSPFYTTMKKQAADLKLNWDSTEDDARSSDPKTSTTDEQVDTIHCMVLDNGRFTVQ